MILSVNHIQKSFLEDAVIKDATFHLEKNEKVGLVGNNGAGKSTLFKIITGDLSPDSGTVVFAKDVSSGYLSQHVDLDSHATIFDEVLSIRQEVLQMDAELRSLENQIAKEADVNRQESLLAKHAALLEKFERENGYAVKSEVTGVLKGLGFTENDFTQIVYSLSGGEKTRISLGKLLLTKPDVLLLDEPTNHLDIHAIEWLETYLLNYPGAVFIISHDRYFLDKLVTKVIDLTQGCTQVYNGNYSDFVWKKKALWAAKIKEYENQQREIKHQEEVIEKLKSFNREKSIKRAESREKMLDKIERIEKPTEEKADMHLSLTPNVLSGNDVLSIKNLKKGFGERTLFDQANIEIKRSEHVLIIGDNGTGKSTLLKMITGFEQPDDGELKYGSNVFIGYYDQEHQTLNPEVSIFDEISNTYPKMTNDEIRNMLAAFLFSGDDVFKLIKDLSGGEKGRVSLAKLMLSDANFLILDEPTNHLDMTSKEILENAIESYEGTVLSVSHDRFYINETATRIIELYKGQFVSYIGNYDYYLEKKDLFHTQIEEKLVGKVEVSAPSKGSEDWKSQKELQAKIRKHENELKAAESLIEQLENEIASIDAELENPEIATNSAKLNELLSKRTELDVDKEKAYEKWEELLEFSPEM